MSENIYHIEQLDCSYDKKKTVLHIEQLDVPRGNVVFFVGPSGIGKSTILETLGFMTNTIQRVCIYEYDDCEVSRMWNKNDTELSTFRMKEFSFVFQQNNLMPNFTAYENIITPALFQGMDFHRAKKETKKILDLIGLPTEDRAVSEYSGGQRQRLALARAILPDFNVLFADEPTGNLDSANADKLMDLIVSSVKEKNSTAIIVSHDINLSVKYADEIVLIRKDKVMNCGIIDEASRYIKAETKWMNAEKQYSDNGMCELLNSSLRNE